MSEQQQNIKIVISVRNIDKKYTFPHYLGTYCRKIEPSNLEFKLKIQFQNQKRKNESNK